MSRKLFTNEEEGPPVCKYCGMRSSDLIVLPRELYHPQEWAHPGCMSKREGNFLSQARIAESIPLDCPEGFVQYYDSCIPNEDT